MIIKRGDDGIALDATLTNLNGEVDLTDANVLFLMNDFQITPQYTDRTNGKLRVIFESTHTSKTGFYNAEFEVKFSDGRVETFPNDDYIKIQIKDDLGGIK